MLLTAKRIWEPQFILAFILTKLMEDFIFLKEKRLSYILITFFECSSMNWYIDVTHNDQFTKCFIPMNLYTSIYYTLVVHLTGQGGLTSAWWKLNDHIGIVSHALILYGEDSIWNYS